MIIPKANRLDEAQLHEVREIVGVFDCRIDVIHGALRDIYAIVGDERHETMLSRLAGLDYIERIDTIDAPYKLMHRRSELADEVFEVGGVRVGQEALFIAGPCTVDPKNASLTLETAQAVKDAGAQVLRGGVWKPRTMPYSYQGDAKALEVLLDARARTGLPLNVEVMNLRQLKLVLEAGIDMIQVGTRNALNYSLLREIGEHTAPTRTPVLLKRSRAMAPVDEFIAAAEYIAAAGNPRILLCPRGTMPAMEGYRNHPDESIVPLLRERTWAPVIVDPSHAVGRAHYVPAAALAAMAYGAQGLCVECHVAPQKGIGDDPRQALTPEALHKLLRDANAVFSLVRET